MRVLEQCGAQQSFRLSIASSPRVVRPPVPRAQFQRLSSKHSLLGRLSSLKVSVHQGAQIMKRPRPDTSATATDMPAAFQDLLPEDSTYDSVSNYYGKVLSTTKDLKTSACTAAGRPTHYIQQLIKQVPQEVKEKFYGCGTPLPTGITGLRVLDLGSGSGRDSYIAAALVGKTGKVTGIDMTEEQLSVAREHADAYCKQLGYPDANLEFKQGHIEYLDRAGIEDESVDVIISNCVVNLSPDKRRVLSEAYRVLAEGGEFYFSDVYCDRRLPKEVVEDEVLFGECISGAMYVQDFIRHCRNVGFTDPRVLSSAKIEIKDPELKAKTGEAQFYSITYRLFKLPGQIETLCEDYGQVAVYKGTIPGSESAYQLDDHHRFVKGKPMLVCGNTAAMVGEDGKSWLSDHFTVSGDRTTHYGLFDCAPVGAEPAPGAQESSGGACC